MKKLYLLIFLSAWLSTKGYSQTAGSYSFSSFSGTYSSIAGLTGTAYIALPGDNVTYDSLPIGFTFQFCGTNYTRLAVCTNGFISLANDTSTSPANIATHIASTGWLMPYWDALSGLFVSGSSTTPFLWYASNGVAPNRVFTLEWKNFNMAGSSCASCKANFQVKLYETTGMIDFVYGPSGFTGMSATIGVANSTTDWQTLPDTGSSPIPSSVAFTTTLPGSPPNGQVYRWGTGCTGTPVAGTASPSIDTGCSAYSSVLNLDSTTSGALGLAYQWQSSLSGTIWANIPGATSISDTAFVTGNIFYRCIVACTLSGLTDTSTGKELFMNPPDSITGAAFVAVCRDSTVTLLDDTPGGMWTSSNTTIATIGSISGIVTCLSSGIDTFTYIFTGCTASKIIQIYIVNGGIIHQYCCWGTRSDTADCLLNEGGSQFIDSIPGGVWSISNSFLATIDATGYAHCYSGAVGYDTIIYTVTSPCGVFQSMYGVGVYYFWICEGKVNMLSNAVSIVLKTNPNPNTGTFVMIISSDWDEDANVTITNLVGEQVKKLTIRTNKDTELKLDQPNGMYFLSAYTMHGSCSSKMVLDQ